MPLFIGGCGLLFALSSGFAHSHYCIYCFWFKVTLVNFYPFCLCGAREATPPLSFITWFFFPQYACLIVSYFISFFSIMFGYRRLHRQRKMKSNYEWRAPKFSLYLSYFSPSSSYISHTPPSHLFHFGGRRVVSLSL